MSDSSDKSLLIGIGIAIGVFGVIGILYILKSRGILNLNNFNNFNSSKINPNTKLNSNIRNDMLYGNVGIPAASDSIVSDNINTLYNNDEKWEIDRAEDGSIKSINVKRDVKVNR